MSGRVDVLVGSFGCASQAHSSTMASGDVVLDLGCGPGADLVHSARKVGPAGRVIGVASANTLIDRDRAIVLAVGLDTVEIRKGTAEDLPVADASVDWVTSNCVVNLSPNRPRVFAEIARVLKLGGQIRMMEVVAERLPAWVRRSALLSQSCIAGDMSEMDCVAGLRLVGLTDVALGGRYVFDADQLVQLSAAGNRVGFDESDIIDALVGRVWSAYFSAAKRITNEEVLS